MFEYIFNQNGQCGTWDCGKPGAVLAYDPMQPKLGGWFCVKCWDRYQALPWLHVILDRRYIAPPFQIPERSESLQPS